MTVRHAGNSVYKTHKRVGRGSATALDGGFPPPRTTRRAAEPQPTRRHDEGPLAAGHPPRPCAPGDGLEHQVRGGLPRPL